MKAVREDEGYINRIKITLRSLRISNTFKQIENMTKNYINKIQSVKRSKTEDFGFLKLIKPLNCWRLCGSKDVFYFFSNSHCTRCNLIGD